MNLYLALIFALLLGLTGCGQKPKDYPAPPPAEVGVVTISAQDVPMTVELPGRVEAVRTAQVRARATGIILKRNFTEGAEVKEGDVLFEIDPAPLEAIVSANQATLAKAQAALSQVESKAKRFEELVKIHAVSQQDFDDIQGLKLQAQAEVQAAEAALKTASLNLGYTKVTAPISGRIGAAKVTEGALVSQTSATELALIQQLDPIYFNFTQASVDVLKLKQALDQGRLQSIAPGEAIVNLVLEDSTAYNQDGKLLFSDVTVDPTSGMVSLRAEFPNPDRVLLPGMFGRVKLEQAISSKAVVAPQRGVAVGPNGTATVMVVTAEHKVEARNVTLGTAVKDLWIITEGLQPGEQIIVDGLQKARPGSPVKPVPFK